MYNYYEGGFESMISEYCAICGKEFKIFPCRKNVTKCCSYEDKSTMLLSYTDKTIMKGEDDLS